MNQIDMHERINTFVYGMITGAAISIGMENLHFPTHQAWEGLILGYLAYGLLRLGWYLARKKHVVSELRRASIERNRQALAKIEQG